MHSIDEQYLKTPFYGSRKMAEVFGVNRKRIQRLVHLMGIEAIYAKPRTTQSNVEHGIYPYLLRNVEILRPNQVWSTDITYLKDYRDGWEAEESLTAYFHFYCHERIHQALDYRTSVEVYHESN